MPLHIKVLNRQKVDDGDNDDVDNNRVMMLYMF